MVVIRFDAGLIGQNGMEIVLQLNGPEYNTSDTILLNINVIENLGKCKKMNTSKYIQDDVKTKFLFIQVEGYTDSTKGLHSLSISKTRAAHTKSKRSETTHFLIN